MSKNIHYELRLRTKSIVLTHSIALQIFKNALITAIISNLFCHYEKKSYFCSPNLVRQRPQKPTTIKRESGGNPGQSRCCKLRQSRFQIPCHCPSRMGRPRNDGVSQKTCQFSFLKSFRGKSLKKDNTSMFDFFHDF